jgi:hypothetical protein
MRSWACSSSSRACSPCVESSPAMVAHRSRTCQYYSAILASSSCVWANCVLMLTPLVSEVAARLASGFGVHLRRMLLSHSHRQHVRQQRPRSTRMRDHSF